MFHILICDDEKDIVNALVIWLTDPDCCLLTASTGREAVEIARQEDLQLILLDIMMPQEDGLHAMQRIREFSNVPIILLTAKSQDEDKVAGLLAGADDYITKPFNPKEVQARVRSQLRRYTQLGGGEPDPGVLRLGGLVLDERSKSVTVDGESVNLTRKEYDILKLLMAHPGQVFAPAEIYRRVWKETPFGGDNTVAVHIRHLREKIEIDPGDPRYVRLVFGQGYVAEKEGKRFSRTKGGKVLFFVGCVLFATLFAASLIVVLELFRWNAFTEPARAFWYLTHTDIPVLKVLTRIPWEHRFLVLGSCPLFLLAAVWCFVRLMAAAGRRPDTEELFPGLTARCPWEIVLAAAAAAGYLWYRTVQWLLRNLIPVEEIRNGLEFLIVTLGLTALGVFVCMDAAVRIKGKTFSDSSLTVRLYRKLPLIWKTLLAAGIVLFLQAFLWVSPWNADRHFPLVLILSSLAVLTAAVLAVRSAIMQRCLEKGGQALAAGDYEYRTETKGLTGAYKAHADNLNHIADGMEKAVEERLKSERMKSELITNVTHDLKTPLTSVVNYAALISEEPCENEKIKEYAGVLVRQADRLKHLIEDLTEAANASAGTTDVQLSPCDAGVLLMQAAGEYEERMQAAGLTLVTGQPETPLLILADSRRMWRIFDNLLNNICKYAQPGTRVYLQLSQCGNTVQTVFKNTSREPLNLSPDELLERFVRGDASRSTDGSGLGLSIAESLAKLQGGTLTLETDGDLFKATLTFPVYKQ